MAEEAGPEAAQGVPQVRGLEVRPQQGQEAVALPGADTVAQDQRAGRCELRMTQDHFSCN